MDGEITATNTRDVTQLVINVRLTFNQLLRQRAIRRDLGNTRGARRLQPQ